MQSQCFKKKLKRKAIFYNVSFGHFNTKQILQKISLMDSCHAFRNLTSVEPEYRFNTIIIPTRLRSRRFVITN